MNLNIIATTVMLEGFDTNMNHQMIKLVQPSSSKVLIFFSFRLIFYIYIFNYFNILILQIKHYAMKAFSAFEISY